MLPSCGCSGERRPLYPREPDNPSIEMLHEAGLFFPLHSQDRTKVECASKLSPRRISSPRSCQLLSFSTSTEWYDRPASTKVPEPLFLRNADRRAGLLLQPAMRPLIRLKCLLQAAWDRVCAPETSSRLDCMLVWRNGGKPKVGERQADAREGRQSGKDQRRERVPRRGTACELGALVPGKSRQRMGFATER